MLERLLAFADDTLGGDPDVALPGQPGLLGPLHDVVALSPGTSSGFSFNLRTYRCYTGNVGEIW